MSDSGTMPRGLTVAWACGIAGLAAQTGLTAQTAATGVRVERLVDAPIVTPSLHPSLGGNIQGPSLIRVPEWIEDRLGAYYLYFADHKGTYIRLAYADDLLGPWRIHPPGSLQIVDSHFLAEPPDVPPAQAERLRAQPSMGKKIKAEMKAQRAAFVEGATEKGVAQDRAEYVFDLVDKFAGYG